MTMLIRYVVYLSTFTINTNTMTDMIKYARRCDVTGEGMNEGYFIENIFTDSYFKYKSDLVQHIERDTCYSGIEEAHDKGYYFYTVWEEIDEDYYYLKDGTEYQREPDTYLIARTHSLQDSNIYEVYTDMEEAEAATIQAIKDAKPIVTGEVYCNEEHELYGEASDGSIKIEMVVLESKKFVKV